MQFAMYVYCVLWENAWLQTVYYITCTLLLLFILWWHAKAPVKYEAPFCYALYIPTGGHDPSLQKAT